MTVFYDSYSSSLFRVILRLVGSTATAEDVLQESMVKIWFSFAYYDPERGRLYTWALNICRHQALDHLRLKRNQADWRTSSWDDCANAHTLTVEAAPPEHIGLREHLHLLRPAYRRLMELRYFSGLTQTEVAEQLDMPLGTVKTHNSAALRQLAALFR